MADRLSRSPRRARPLTGRGRLPDVQNLVDRTAPELVSILNRFGIDPDLKAIEKRANRAFERLDEILESGLEPDAATWDAIDKGVETAMTQNLRKMVKTAIRKYREARMLEVSDKLTWLTVGGSRVCPSCKPRHGKVKTYKQWERMGLPGSPALICREECRCNLIPVPSKA